MMMSLAKAARAGAVLSLGLGAAAAAQAQSSVQLYGLIDMAVGSYETSGGDRTTRAESGGMTTSYLGFKGAEDLGGGLSAVFALDTFLRADTGEAGRFGGDAFWARNANVGLSGGFGTVKLGRAATPLFVSTLLFNPFGDSFGFSPAIRTVYSPTTKVAGDTGWSNGISYSTPNVSGLSATVTYVLKEALQGGNFGGNVLYFNGPVGLTLAWQQVKVPFASGKETAWQLGGSYNFGPVKAFAQYSQVKETTTGTASANTKDKIYQLGATVPVGAGSVLASYGVAKTTPTGATTKRDIFSLGYDHFLSKRTDVYVVYMYDKIKSLDSGNTFAVGIRHRF